MSAAKTLLLVLCFAGATPAAARVAPAPGGFASEHEVVLALPPASTWKRLLDVASWWSGAHSYSGDAKRLTLDPRAGGCWCETTPGGGSIEHMRVIYAEPGKLLRLAGGLGPLHSDPVVGVMTVTLSPVTEGTRVIATYKVAGPAVASNTGLAAAVDKVLAEQFARLAAVGR